MLNEDRQLAKEVEGICRTLIASMNRAAPVGATVEFDDEESDPLIEDLARLCTKQAR
jgi:hypothetical protein